MKDQSYICLNKFNLSLVTMQVTLRPATATFERLILGIMDISFLLFSLTNEQRLWRDKSKSNQLQHV